jgi:hypothetical protein
MANDSRVNLKMAFEIVTDKEIEKLKERAIRQRNFYAANLLRWEADERSQPMAKLVPIFIRSVSRSGRCFRVNCHFKVLCRN